jgi:hypothetical protein
MIADMPSHCMLKETSGYCCEECQWLEDERLNAEFEEADDDFEG